MIATLPPPHVEPEALPRVTSATHTRPGISLGIFSACLVLAVAATYLATRLHVQNAELADVKAQLFLSNARVSEVQSGLGAAKAQAETLQAQLASDQGQRSSLQAQVDQANARAASLQEQQARDQGLRADLQAQVEQAKAQAARVQAQATRATEESATLRTQLDQARTQASGAEAQLAKAQGDLTRLHPLLVEARQLPLTATFEKSFWDQGFTLHVSNAGSTALNLRIRISGQDKARAEMAVIEAGATLNVGRLPAGEAVVIASDGFDPLNLTAR